MMLFTPFKLGGVELRNRIVMPPFGLNFTGIKRKPNERLIEFYRERARGGAGLLVVGGVGVDLRGSGYMLPGIEDDSMIPAWAELATAVHQEGAKLFLQLFHSGRYSHSRLAKGMQPVAPSAVSSRYNPETPHALEQDEIREIQQLFYAGARRAREAGADGVELIGSAGYLISQFLSPVSNLREDQYGGSLENRCRFGEELIRGIKAELGAEFPVTLRISGNEFVPGGNTNLEMVEICRRFEAAGADGFNVTGGWHETRVPQLTAAVPQGAYTYLAAAIRAGVSVPVSASNRIVEPAQAEALLQDGVCDLVSIGRSLIADPEWPNKARRGQDASIRPCVACMQGCLDRLFTLKPVECLCNPRAGYEAKRSLSPAARPMKVLVVGGGPAGLEAAVTLADRGHEVILAERSQTLGGQLPLVGIPPGRRDFHRLIRFYTDAVRQRNIRVETGLEITLDRIRELGPDHVVLATGASPTLPGIPGLAESRCMVSSWDILRESRVPGRRVVVLGGGAVGIETALFIADRGTMDGETLKFLLRHGAETPDTLKELVNRSPRRVTILEKLEKIGSDVGLSNRWVFLKELDLLGVKAIASAEVLSVDQDRVVFRTAEGEESLEADTIVVALGSRSENVLGPQLEAEQIPFTIIGDALKPRNILNSIHEGFLAAAGL